MAELNQVKLGWKRVVVDPKFVGACVSFITLIGSAFIMGAGRSPAEKLEFFKTAVYGAAAIFASALAALGYETGKLFEGMTPAGFVPSGKPPTVICEGTDKPNKLPAWLWLTLSASLLAMGAGGCSSTSEQFRAAIPAGVNNVVQDMRSYIAANDYDANHNGQTEPSEAQAKADETKKTDALAASVADPKAIKVTTVEKSWNEVKPIWNNYVNNDPTLTDPRMKQTILNTGSGIDALIQVEKQRGDVLGNLLSGLKS